jgi:hypothetical protein
VTKIGRVPSLVTCCVSVVSIPTEVRHALAALMSTVLTLLAWQGGTATAVVLLRIALSIITFTLMTAAPDLIAYQRKHPWRWWWRSSDDEGPFWPGALVPRHTR